MATSTEKKIKGQHGRSTRLILGLIRRFHLLMFFIIVVIGLAVAVVMLNRTLTGTSTDDFLPTINHGSIDESTLNRIQSLHTSDEATKPQLPEGRINPFAE